MRTGSKITSRSGWNCRDLGGDGSWLLALGGWPPSAALKCVRENLCCAPPGLDRPPYTPRLTRLRKKSGQQIPRSSSPRKRGYGRLGMTRVKDLSGSAKAEPFQISAPHKTSGIDPSATNGSRGSCKGLALVHGQEEGKGATWMFEDAYAKHKHWQKFTVGFPDGKSALPVAKFGGHDSRRIAMTTNCATLMQFLYLTNSTQTTV